MARPPQSLPPSGIAPLKVSLILGSFEHDPLQVHIFDLVVPPSASAPQHAEEPSFHLRPEIEHIFQPEPVSPPKLISAVFTVLVLTPWLVLISLVCQNYFSINNRFIHFYLISFRKYPTNCHTSSNPRSLHLFPYSELLKDFFCTTGLLYASVRYSHMELSLEYLRFLLAIWP